MAQAAVVLSRRGLRGQDLDRGDGAIGAWAVLTDRARREVCRLVGEEARSVAEVARSFGVSWNTAMGAVREHDQPLVEDAARIGAVADLSIDETSWLAATHEHPSLWARGLVDTAEGAAGRDPGPQFP